MDLDPVRANRTTSKPPSDPDSSNRSLVRVARATPRPTSPLYKGAKHNKQAERTRLGLCFYCGSPAHWIADCPSCPPVEDKSTISSDISSNNDP
jgi:hypothetical protein